MIRGQVTCACPFCNKMDVVDVVFNTKELTFSSYGDGSFTNSTVLDDYVITTESVVVECDKCHKDFVADATVSYLSKTRKIQDTP